jgi:uncharacterized protein with von Willebrand factor type A (vWA) domain
VDSPHRARAAASSDQLLAFVQYLRGRKIPVSPADTLDAVEVAELVGYQNRSLLKNGLAAALAKSQHELSVFEAAFDDYFQPIPERPPAGGQSNVHPEGSSATMPQQAPQTDPTAQGEDPLDGLRGNSLFDALEAQDESALSVAIETAAAEAKVEEISLFTQRGQYVRKILDALGDEALREAAIEFEQRSNCANGCVIAWSAPI